MLRSEKRNSDEDRHHRLRMIAASDGPGLAEHPVQGVLLLGVDYPSISCRWKKRYFLVLVAPVPKSLSINPLRG